MAFAFLAGAGEAAGAAAVGEGAALGAAEAEVTAAAPTEALGAAYKPRTTRSAGLDAPQKKRGVFGNVMGGLMSLALSHPADEPTN